MLWCVFRDCVGIHSTSSSIFLTLVCARFVKVCCHQKLVHLAKQQMKQSTNLIPSGPPRSQVACFQFSTTNFAIINSFSCIRCFIGTVVGFRISVFHSVFPSHIQYDFHWSLKMKLQTKGRQAVLEIT